MRVMARSWHNPPHEKTRAPHRPRRPGVAHSRGRQDVRLGEAGQSISITRDDWGIPHVSGKTDAARCSRDVRTGRRRFQSRGDELLNSIGRLAEAEGEAEIYRDLRMKLFIDPPT